MCKEDIIFDIEYDESYNRYFLSMNILNYTTLILDYEIANYLSISIKYYRENLLKYNAIIDSDESYFYTFNDCKKAIKWIENNLEYFLILKKLEGN